MADSTSSIDDFDLDDLDSIVDAHNNRTIEKSDDLDSSIDEFLESGEVSIGEDSNSQDSSDDEVVLANRADQHSSIEAFSRYVIDEIIKKGLPPTPQNFSIYFEELLNSQAEKLKQELFDIFEVENVGADRKEKIEHEKDIKRSLALIQQLLNVTAKIGKNMGIMRNIIVKRDDELKSRKRNSKDTLSLIRADLEKLDSIIARQGESMKGLYSRTDSIVQNVTKQTIFDTNFGIYNRRHFLGSIRTEVQKMGHFGHKSSLLLLIPNRELTAKYIDKRVADLILKSIAKILQQNFKQNDVVSYYGHNIFAVMVTHSSLIETEDKIFKLSNALRSSALFIGGKEVKIKVKMGIGELSLNRRPEDSLICTFNALEKANKVKSFQKNYDICSEM
jgi:diguanylate cyclase (GGDEF)-like protein